MTWEDRMRRQREADALARAIPWLLALVCAVMAIMIIGICTH